MRRLRVLEKTSTQCERCEKLNVRIVACITEPVAIQKVLAHLDKRVGNGNSDENVLLPRLSASPSESLIEDYVIQRDFYFGA